jgi:hypothetical protein
MEVRQGEVYKTYYLNISHQKWLQLFPTLWCISIWANLNYLNYFIFRYYGLKRNERELVQFNTDLLKQNASSL